MKQLDLTEIPYNLIKLSWLSRIVAQVRPKILLITKEQSEGIFSSWEVWTHYRDAEIKIK